MNALALALLASIVGVDYGWQVNRAGELEYIVQIEPQLVAALRNGEKLESEIPPNMRNIRRIIVRIGTGELPHDPLPAEHRATPAAATSPPIRRPGGIHPEGARAAQPATLHEPARAWAAAEPRVVAQAAPPVGTAPPLTTGFFDRNGYRTNDPLTASEAGAGQIGGAFSGGAFQPAGGGFKPGGPNPGTSAPPLTPSATPITPAPDNPHPVAGGTHPGHSPRSSEFSATPIRQPPYNPPASRPAPYTPAPTTRPVAAAPAPTDVKPAPDVAPPRVSVPPAEPLMVATPPRGVIDPGYTAGAALSGATVATRPPAAVTSPPPVGVPTSTTIPSAAIPSGTMPAAPALNPSLTNPALTPAAPATTGATGAGLTGNGSLANLAGDRPWWMLSLIAVLLFVSVGMNFYLWWVARGIYNRYRRLTAEIRDGAALL